MRNSLAIPEDVVAGWVRSMESGVPLAEIARAQGREVRYMRKTLAHRKLPTTVEKARARKEGRGPDLHASRARPRDRRPKAAVQDLPAAWPMPVRSVFELAGHMAMTGVNA